MDWWNILIFEVIPVLTVVIMFIVKRKLLWATPLISMVLAFITYMIALEIINPAVLISFFWKYCQNVNSPRDGKTVYNRKRLEDDFQ